MYFLIAYEFLLLSLIIERTSQSTQQFQSFYFPQKCLPHYVSFHFLSSPPICIPPPLEHRNRVRGIRRPRLRHVPMLNKARPLHPINVRQSNGLHAQLINTNMDEADAVIEAMSEDYRGYKGDDLRQFLLIRNPTLSIKGIMLGQVESDVLVESTNDVFFAVELVDEAVEDLALDVFGRRVAGAVAGVGVGAGEEAWC